MPSTKETIQENKTKETIQEIKTNENGQKVKIIKKVVLIPKGVAERKVRLTLRREGEAHYPNI